MTLTPSADLGHFGSPCRQNHPRNRQKAVKHFAKGYNRCFCGGTKGWRAFLSGRPDVNTTQTLDISSFGLLIFNHFPSIGLIA